MALTAACSAFAASRQGFTCRSARQFCSLRFPYEDNFAGKLSDERYSRMAAKYEKEQVELLQSVSTKEKELANLERESVDIRLLLAGLREYSSMETLTPEVVNKIIKRIEVHNSEMVNGHKRVGIDIHFTGVGLVDLTTIKEMLAIAESSRP